MLPHRELRASIIASPCCLAIWISRWMMKSSQRILGGHVGCLDVEHRLCPPCWKLWMAMRTMEFRPAALLHRIEQMQVTLEKRSSTTAPDRC